VEVEGLVVVIRLRWLGYQILQYAFRQIEVRGFTVGLRGDDHVQPSATRAAAEKARHHGFAAGHEAREEGLAVAHRTAVDLRNRRCLFGGEAVRAVRTRAAKRDVA